MTQHLYLVRHGQHRDAEHGVGDGPLSPKGVRQAEAIAERLGGVPFTSVRYAPSTSATQTVRILAERLPSLQPEPSALLLECVPSAVPPGAPKVFDAWFHSVTEEEIDAGRAQMDDAVAAFLGAGTGDRHDLLVTHNFVIGWFVRQVLDAPEWRWIGLNQAHCGLTVLRARSGRPPVLLAHNDLAHLPVELRTGLPEPLPI